VWARPLAFSKRRTSRLWMPGGDNACTCLAVSHFVFPRVSAAMPLLWRRFVCPLPALDNWI